MKEIKKLKLFFVTLFLLITVLNICWTQNYSKQLQQAILLYQEGKNTDAMDRFMDILVSGTPEEKKIASEYISKITQGIPPEKNKSDTKVIIMDSKSEDKGKIKQNLEIKYSTQTQSNKVISSSQQIQNNSEIQKNNEISLSEKIQKKIKEIENEILTDLYRKETIKIYMNENNEKPNYILLKENKVFNEDMTFKSNALGDLKLIAGFFTVLDKATVIILPNGVITGNMKIANVRRATVLHSYFLSFGLSPTKIKLDMIGELWNNVISKKIDDYDGILFVIDYDKEPELNIDFDSPKASIAIYPDKIDIAKDQASVINFAVIVGKNSIANWKMTLNKKTKSNIQTVQKIE
ncbi:MAG: hypothetical protein N2446_03265, partial [Elusimicrobiales bacterium]|nr:hypothetical protein [Elusimicrobiales bacterium]